MGVPSGAPWICRRHAMDGVPWVCYGFAVDVQAICHASAMHVLYMCPALPLYVLCGSAVGRLRVRCHGSNRVCHGYATTDVAGRHPRAMNIWWVRHKFAIGLRLRFVRHLPPSTVLRPALRPANCKHSGGKRVADVNALRLGVPERVDPLRIRQPRTACRHAMGCAMGMPRVRYECSTGGPWVCNGRPLDVPWMRLVPRTCYVTASHSTAYVPRMCNA